MDPRAWPGACHCEDQKDQETARSQKEAQKAGAPAQAKNDGRC